MKWEDVTLWVINLLAGLALCGARLGWLLFKVAPIPPEDKVALEMWRLKRRWLIISELSALPSFATLAIIIGRLRHWPIEGMILFSMILGALGFAFFLDALQTILRKKLGLFEGSNNANT